MVVDYFVAHFLGVWEHDDSFPPIQIRRGEWNTAGNPTDPEEKSEFWALMLDGYIT